MAYIKEYWKEKEIKAKIAKKHTEDMNAEYADEIQKSINNTKIYDEKWMLGKSTKNTQNDMQGILSTLDSVSAVLEFADSKTALLNFASYKHPGGCFMDGSVAQEECLCHSSFLYNVLKEFSDYYKYNNQNLNKSLYKNRALYSSDIIFKQNGQLKYCDVITCAAPNKSAAQKYCKVPDEINKEVLESRIKFVLDIAEDNNVETLILGAYGAGVFGQDATEVATIFKDTLKQYNYHFKKIIFAIPEGKNNNYKKFKNVLL